MKEEEAVFQCPDRRIPDLFGIEIPLLLAPMAGSAFADLAVAVAEAGGLGSLACAMLSPAQVRAETISFRQRSTAPLNLNFFCHAEPRLDPERDARWQARLASYFAELGLDPALSPVSSNRVPFDHVACDLVEELKPGVVSFHFGLPAPDLLDRVKASDAKVISTATTVTEARWLEERGCDAIIAQGEEAGGHRGIFLSEDLSTQGGTATLLPAVVAAVKVPVIAAGGIGNGARIAAALALGASAVQLGTAYLLCPEAATSPLHRAALRMAKRRETALTNIFTGRPARGLVNRLMRELGPISPDAPDFPRPAAMLAALRARAEAAGSEDFSPLWAGEAAALAREVPAAQLTRDLWADALQQFRKIQDSAMT